MDTRFDSKSAPTSFRERIDIVDILRGFALIGVIVANFQHMISWDYPSGTVDAATVWFLENLVSGKFYRLFAFLFGLGFALQMARLESRGVRFVPLYVRRLMILGLIGIAHGILFWPEDILALFAQFGLLLLLMRRVSNRSIAIIAIACLLAPHAYYYASTGFADFRQGKPAAVQEQEAAERTKRREAREAETHRIRSEGTYREVVDTEQQTHGEINLIIIEAMEYAGEGGQTGADGKGDEDDKREIIKIKEKFYIIVTNTILRIASFQSKLFL